MTPSPQLPDTVLAAVKLKEIQPKETKTKPKEEKEKEKEKEEEEIADSEPDDGPIIPWRAQLRKTNSKLNILD